MLTALVTLGALICLRAIAEFTQLPDLEWRWKKEGCGSGSLHFTCGPPRSDFVMGLKYKFKPESMSAFWHCENMAGLRVSPK